MTAAAPSRICVRCHKPTDRPVLAQVVEVGSGPGAILYGCPDCAWPLYLDHAVGCPDCRRSGQCDIGSGLHAASRRAAR